MAATVTAPGRWTRRSRICPDEYVGAGRGNYERPHTLCEEERVVPTTIGVFNSHHQAERAVEALHDEGFTEDEISVIAKDTRGGDSQNDGGMDSVADGMAWGGGLGALGGLLAGIGALTIPGIGPIVAAGPLAATLSGAVAGGIGGGLLDMGIPEDRGREYEEDVKQGRILCIVETDDEDRSEDAVRILQESGADDVETHG